MLGRSDWWMVHSIFDCPEQNQTSDKDVLDFDFLVAGGDGHHGRLATELECVEFDEPLAVAVGGGFFRLPGESDGDLPALFRPTPDRNGHSLLEHGPGGEHDRESEFGRRASFMAKNDKQSESEHERPFHDQRLSWREGN